MRNRGISQIDPGYSEYMTPYILHVCGYAPRQDRNWEYKWAHILLVAVVYPIHITSA